MTGFARARPREKADGTIDYKPKGRRPNLTRFLMGFEGDTMDFDLYNPFNPSSPEALIHKFRLKHCSSINYSQYDALSETIIINDSSLTLPIDDFLRSISEFKPINRSVFSHGHHVYIR